MPTPKRRTWYPTTSRAGARLINDKHRYILATGPRKSSKTFTICQKVADHIYGVNGAIVAIVVKRRKTGEVGAWTDLTKYVIENEYQNKGGIIPWRKRPAASSASKHQFCSVVNAHGGTSDVHLFSLYRDADAEIVFKNTRFSMIYICEADQFESRSIFRAMADQLRVPGVDYDKHQLILDCNPPANGTDHWIAKEFGITDGVETEDGDDIDEIENDGEDAKYRDQFSVHRFTLDDNIFISAAEKRDIVNAYKHDADLYRRYVLGEWIVSNVGSIFEGVFSKSEHVIGDDDPSVDESHRNVLVPAYGTWNVAIGWDLGNVSHAAEFGAARISKKEIAMDMFDEVVSTDLEIPLKTIVQMVMEKMDMWEKFMMERGATHVNWFHWSDTSAFHYKSGADATEASLVHGYSDGRISLRRAIKGPSSVSAGIDLIKRMLADGQLFISPRCEKLIQSLTVLRPKDLYGSSRGTGKRRRHTHPLDAARYAIVHELRRVMRDPGSLSTADVGSGARKPAQQPGSSIAKRSWRSGGGMRIVVRR